MQKLQRGFTMGAIGGGVAAFFSAKAFGQFEEKINLIRVSLGETGKGFDKYAANMRKIARETRFTAGEVADITLIMSRSGLFRDMTKDAGDAVGRVNKLTRALLTLSTATGTELATSSEIAIDFMRAFGIQSEKSENAVSKMMNTVNNASLTLSDLGETLKTGGAAFAAFVGKGAGQENEFLTMLSLLANIGIKGSLAGTAVKNFVGQINDLKKMDNFEEQFGFRIVTTDDTGTQLPMAQIFKNIEDAMDKAGIRGQALRGSIYKELVGFRGMALPSTIGDFSELENYEEVMKRISTDGVSSLRKGQEIMEDGLLPTTKKLVSAFTDMGISIGKAISPEIIALFKNLSTKLLDLSDFITRNSEAAKELFASFLRASAIVGGVLALTVAIKLMAFTFGTLLAPVLLTVHLVRALGSALLLTLTRALSLAGIQVLSLSVFMDKLRSSAKGLKSLFMTGIITSGKGLLGTLKGIRTVLGSVVRVAWQLIVFDTVIDVAVAAFQLLRGVITDVIAEMGNLLGSVSEVAGILGKAFAAGDWDTVADSIKLGMELIKDSAIRAFGIMRAHWELFVARLMNTSLVKTITFIMGLMMGIGKALTDGFAHVMPMFKELFSWLAKKAAWLTDLFAGVGDSIANSVIGEWWTDWQVGTAQNLVSKKAKKEANQSADEVTSKLIGSEDKEDIEANRGLTFGEIFENGTEEQQKVALDVMAESTTRWEKDATARRHRDPEGAAQMMQNKKDYEAAQQRGEGRAFLRSLGSQEYIPGVQGGMAGTRVHTTARNNSLSNFSNVTRADVRKFQNELSIASLLGEVAPDFNAPQIEVENKEKELERLKKQHEEEKKKDADKVALLERKQKGRQLISDGAQIASNIWGSVSNMVEEDPIWNQIYSTGSGAMSYLGGLGSGEAISGSDALTSLGTGFAELLGIGNSAAPKKAKADKMAQISMENNNRLLSSARQTLSGFGAQSAGNLEAQFRSAVVKAKDPVLEEAKKSNVWLGKLQKVANDQLNVAANLFRNIGSR